MMCFCESKLEKKGLKEKKKANVILRHFFTQREEASQTAGHGWAGADTGDRLTNSQNVPSSRLDCAGGA